MGEEQPERGRNCQSSREPQSSRDRKDRAALSQEEDEGDFRSLPTGHTCLPAPQEPDNRQPAPTLGQRWGWPGGVWSRRDKGPALSLNQSSWRQLRVYNLGWGLMGGGGLLEEIMGWS